MASNLGLRGERLVTNRLCPATVTCVIECPHVADTACTEELHYNLLVPTEGIIV